MPRPPAPSVPPAAPVSAAEPSPPPADAAPFGFEVDTRRPPKLKPPAHARTSTSGPVPTSALPPRSAWEAARERTIEFDAPAPKPTPRLETEPFRPMLADVPPLPVTPPRPVAPPVAPSPVAPVPAPPSFVAPPPVAPRPAEPVGVAPAAPPGFPTRVASAPLGPARSPVATAPAVEAPALSPAHDRARRLARVLVSDVLVYNQPVRDRALAEGTLAAALGSEITKAWELYKSKVSPEVVATTTYFKDALNEILAGGEKIF